MYGAKMDFWYYFGIFRQLHKPEQKMELFHKVFLKKDVHTMDVTI